MLKNSDKFEQYIVVLMCSKFTMISSFEFRHVKIHSSGQDFIYSLLKTPEVKPGTLGVSLIQASVCVHDHASPLSAIYQG